ncbi:MAG: signal peptide peptidase SppA [Bacteroidales bacterium]|nr:signal peptide peptidase SppA [Bacteroidales bacterium]
MIKKFFTGVLSSFVGAWIALFVFSVSSVIMSFAFIGAFAESTSLSSGVQDKSVLYLNMASSFAEQSNPDDALRAMFRGNSDVSTSSLATVLKALRVAKDNDKIEGVFVECNGSTAGVATLSEIRRALQEFKESGKWVVAYGNSAIAQSDYYVASVADSIMLNPVGAVDIHGLSTSIPFFKRLLDKIGVEMQVVRVGTFKSAVEPYVETEASVANRTATEAYMTSIWGDLAKSISESRGISVDKLNGMADSLLMTQPVGYLLENNIIDGLCYRFDMMERLKDKSGVSASDDLRLVSPEDVAALAASTVAIDKVAVVYAVGEIDGSDDGVNSSELVKDIIKIAKDDAVKAVVLRVNSPGGSAYGSEQIWAAFEEVKKAGKPFAVSMGDLAASGGYYISCGADKIFAEPVTITGSIGIFGLIPCVKELVNDKLGVNFSVINTNKNGNFISITEPMTVEQRVAMQKMINQGYELFTTRCAEGRGMELDALKKIAEGRVWDGITAKEIGLVDEFGNLSDAIDYVVEQAKIGEYSINEYPQKESSFMRYLKISMKAEVNEILGTETNGLSKYKTMAEDILSRDYVQCIMEPVEIR